jgi:hypothetical protein
MSNASLVHITPMAPLGGGSGLPRGGSGLLKNNIWSFKRRRSYFTSHRKGSVGQSLADPNGTSNGPWSEPPKGGSPSGPPWGGPPSGPPGGPLKRRFPCNLCYPLPILVAILAPTLITPPLTKKVYYTQDILLDLTSMCIFGFLERRLMQVENEKMWISSTCFI